MKGGIPLDLKSCLGKYFSIDALGMEVKKWSTHVKFSHEA